MAVLKCKMCGGELTIREGISIIKCDYCGNTNTLPKENSANNHDLFARANELRARCEFDLAERAYEKIIEVAPQEAEAYWGLVLCKYGIEYVEDPTTKKRIPTCHRASFEAITADYNYQKAIEYADVVSRPVYEEEARVIDTIQKEILALSYKEEKYDVFICYKETDDNGKRTEDSAIANDIYYQLTQEGYKVFYAAITLEDKLGQDYEPIIFAALNSAKVMLVVGTKAEYFNAVWVKNEWSRFLKIMKQDRAKLMFPCYKGISAYELPDELSHMQAQDMGKIGFINDLIRGIKKVIVKEKPKKETPSGSAQQQPVASKMNPTLRRAFIFIEDGNWAEANEYLEKVLDQEPENALAYLGKLLIDLKVKKQEKLAEQSQTFDNNQNYKKAYKYADKELKEKLNGYNEAISKRNDEKKKDEEYSAALAFVAKAKTEEDYKQAGKKFAALSGWKDSSRRAKEYFDKAEAVRKDGIYAKALAWAQSKVPAVIKQSIPLFESIPDWKDSSELLAKIPELCETARKNAIYDEADKKYKGTDISKIKEAQKLFLSIEAWKDSKKKAELCIKRIQELEEKAEQERLAREKAERELQIAEAKKKKLIKKVSIISGSAVVAIAIALVLLFTLIIPTIQFNKATELFNAGKYDEAIAIYNKLDGFGESNNKINVIDAINTVEDGDYEDGIEKMLNNGATVTISYDCAGGELSTTNTKSVKATANSTKNVIIASAEDSSTSFTYNNVNDFEGLKPSTRNGHTFKQWKLVTCTPTITKNSNSVSISFVAEWIAKDYTVTYDLDGGNVNGENVIGYNPDDESFTLINPTRTGYTFIGWTGTDLADETMEVTVPSGSYGNRSYTANWQANTYTVTYDANGGTASKTEDTATYDEGFTLATVERKGYTFLGWFSDTTQYEDFDNWERIEGLDLKAEWQINTYTITYTLNGGNVTNVETYTVEDTVIINAPEKTGYTFDGWTGTGLSEETKSITLAKGTIDDKEYTANWTANTYKVTYDANGGTASKTEDTATYDSNFTLATAERKGYDFVGWKADNTTYQNGDWKTAKDITLVAEWKIANYAITYNLDGGNASGNPATYTINDTVTLIAPERTGYTFTGWTGTDLSGKTMSVTIPEGSVGAREYTANWTANEYTLSFNVNGGDALVSNSKTVVYDSRYSVPTPTRRGYDFVAWKTSTGVVYSGGNWKTAGNVTVIAEWKIINYSITYNLDGGSVNGANFANYTVEDTITLKNPTKTGYTFAGWTGTDLSGKTMSVTIPKGSIGAREYTATWTANTYTLTYNVNGGNALADDMQSVTYNASYSVVEPTRTGYSFVEWKTSTGIVYAGGIWNTTSDVEIIAQWSANTYTVTYDDVSIQTNNITVMFDYNYSGSEPKVVTLTNGQTLTYPTVPTRSGHVFVGWYTDNSCTTAYNFSGTITTDITLYAKWVSMTSSYSTREFVDIANYNSSSTKKSFSNITSYSSSTQHYYYFTCYTSGSYSITAAYTTGDFYLTVYNVTQNKTVIDKVNLYSGNTSKTTTFSANAGDVFYVSIYKYNSGSSTGSGTFYVTNASYPTSTATASCSTVADWVYDTTSTHVITATFDENVTLMEPIRIGYTFGGWLNNGVAVNNGEWKIANNATLTANWIPNVYRLTLNVNGGVCSDGYVDVTFDQSYTLPAPTRVGYTFAGWWNNGTEYPNGIWTLTNGIELTAKWIANTDTDYVVKHYQQNITDNKYTLVVTNELEGTSDASITPAVNTYTGFTSPATQTTTINPNGTTVVEYYYTRNSYTLTYVMNGGEEIATETLKYQAEISLSENATRANYTFGGWFTDATLAMEYDIETMPAQNQTVYAWWSEENKAGEFSFNSGIITACDSTDLLVWIPEYIGNEKVEVIGDSVFARNNYITKVIIANSITSIRANAFANCLALEEIVIPDSVISIGANSFDNCVSLSRINSSVNGQINLPTNLVVLSSYIFNKCLSITEINVGKITTIESYAFSKCTNLIKFNSTKAKELIIPEGTTSIGDFAFQNLSLIEKVVIPDSIILMGKGSFKGCNSLIDITLPFVGKTIDSGCDQKAYSTMVGGYLSGYYIGHTGSSDGVLGVLGYIFDYITQRNSSTPPDSSAIYQYYYNSYGKNYDNTDYYFCYIPKTIRNVTITRDTTIMYGAFKNCDFIEKITLPINVSTIISGAFDNCSAEISKTYVPSIDVPWTGNVATKFAGGDGSEESPYLIQNANQFAYFAQQVNDGNSYEGKFIQLDINLDLANLAFPVIGSSANQFKGIFNGSGHFIKNVVISSSDLYVGLFAYNAGIIQNLAIENISLIVSGNVNNVSVGGLVAYNSGIISNCYLTGVVQGSCDSILTIGGFVGVNNGTIQNCYTTANVNGTSAYFRVFAGGFVGQNTTEGKIEGCFAFGDVVSKGMSEIFSLVGGFVADNAGAITNCYRCNKQVITKYATVGLSTCSEGIVASVNEMLSFATINWDSEIWNFNNGSYPILK